MLNDPHHRGSQDTGKGADADRRTVDWQKVFLTDPVLAEVFSTNPLVLRHLKRAIDDHNPISAINTAAEFHIGEITGVAEFHRVLEEKFFDRYFKLPYREDGRNRDATYFPELQRGTSSFDTLEIVRDALYTKLYAHWFAQVYMVERYGIERFERETGTPTLAGLFDSLKINNPREQLFVLYQIISRNLRDSDNLDLPEGLKNEPLSAPHRELILSTTSDFRAFAYRKAQGVTNNPPPPRYAPGKMRLIDQCRPFDFEMTLGEIGKSREWLSRREISVEERNSSQSSTPYVERSTLDKFNGFNPVESPSRVAGSCIYNPRCFAELLDFHADVGWFVVTHGGRDHEILSGWVGYRRLLTHSLLDEGMIVLDADAGRLSDSASNSSLEQNLNFESNSIFKNGVFGRIEVPFHSRLYFHLFIHDCGHALLRGFYEPGTDFELFRLAWVGAEHYARWFSDYEVMKRVAQSPFWRDQPPFTPWEHLSKQTRSLLLSEMHDVRKESQVLAYYRYFKRNKLNLYHLYRPHNLYEIIRDAGIHDETQGRDFLLRFNTCPDYENDPIARLPRKEALKTNVDTEAADALIARVTEQYPQLSQAHKISLRIQLSRNVQDQDYIAATFDKVNDNSRAAFAALHSGTLPSSKLRSVWAFERFLRGTLHMHGVSEPAVDEERKRGEFSGFFADAHNQAPAAEEKYDDRRGIFKKGLRGILDLVGVTHFLNHRDYLAKHRAYLAVKLPAYSAEVEKRAKDRYFEPPKNTLETFASFTDRALFDQRFADTPLEQREKVWSYLSRCGAVMKYLMDDSPNTEAKSEES